MYSTSYAKASCCERQLWDCLCPAPSKEKFWDKAGGGFNPGSPAQRRSSPRAVRGKPLVPAFCRRRIFTWPILPSWKKTKTKKEKQTPKTPLTDPLLYSGSDHG